MGRRWARLEKRQGRKIHRSAIAFVRHHALDRWAERGPHDAPALLTVYEQAVFMGHYRRWYGYAWRDWVLLTSRHPGGSWGIDSVWPLRWWLKRLEWGDES